MLSLCMTVYVRVQSVHVFMCVCKCAGACAKCMCVCKVCMFLLVYVHVCAYLLPCKTIAKKRIDFTSGERAGHGAGPARSSGG